MSVVLGRIPTRVTCKKWIIYFENPYYSIDWTKIYHDVAVLVELNNLYTLRNFPPLPYIGA